MSACPPCVPPGALNPHCVRHVSALCLPCACSLSAQVHRSRLGLLLDLVRSLPAVGQGRGIIKQNSSHHCISVYIIYDQHLRFRNSFFNLKLHGKVCWGDRSLVIPVYVLFLPCPLLPFCSLACLSRPWTWTFHRHRLRSGISLFGFSFKGLLIWSRAQKDRNLQWQVLGSEGRIDPGSAST